MVEINGNSPAFTGETFMEIYPKLTSCMDEIIELLIKITEMKNGVIVIQVVHQ